MDGAPEVLGWSVSFPPQAELCTDREGRMIKPGPTSSTGSVGTVHETHDNIFLFLYLFCGGQGRERERERERIPSRLHAMSTEPHEGLSDSTNPEIMT